MTIRELVINALRMRPDRIVVGECRGAEAVDMLTAMNTGHDGSLTTLHANSPRDVLSRVVTMVRYGVDLPVDVIEANAASVPLHCIRLPSAWALLCWLSLQLGCSVFSWRGRHGACCLRLYPRLFCAWCALVVCAIVREDLKLPCRRLLAPLLSRLLRAIRFHRRCDLSGRVRRNLFGRSSCASRLQ